MIEAFENDGFCVLKSLLSSFQVNHLRTEIEQLAKVRDREREDEYFSCAMDVIPSHAISPTSLSRVDFQAYLNLRFSHLEPELNHHMKAQHNATMRSILTILHTQCAKILLGLSPSCVEGGGVVLFNEHFVVKPSSSSYTFPLHSDRHKQLLLLLPPQPSIPSPQPSIPSPQQPHKEEEKKEDVEDGFPPYLSCWVALDEIGSENGVFLSLFVYVLLISNF